MPIRKILLSIALVSAIGLGCLALNSNEYVSFFGVTPVAQQTGAVRTALINYGLLPTDGTITATASSGAATLSKYQGTITSESLSTAAGATYTLTLTNTLVTTSSIILASVDANGSTGAPVVASVTPGSGSVTIKIQNIHASAAFNAAIKISFVLAKA